MISKRRFFFSFYPPIRKKSDGHPAALFLCFGGPNPFCAGRGFPDAPMVPLDFVGRDDPARQTTLRTINHSAMWKDGRDGSKTISFSLPEKETVFGIQRKRGSRTG